MIFAFRKAIDVENYLIFRKTLPNEKTPLELLLQSIEINF